MSPETASISKTGRIMLKAYDIASDNHVVGTKCPVVHLAHLVDVLDSNDLPKHENNLLICSSARYQHQQHQQQHRQHQSSSSPYIFSPLCGLAWPSLPWLAWWLVGEAMLVLLTVSTRTYCLSACQLFSLNKTRWIPVMKQSPFR